MEWVDRFTSVRSVATGTVLCCRFLIKRKLWRSWWRSPNLPLTSMNLYSETWPREYTWTWHVAKLTCKKSLTSFFFFFFLPLSCFLFFFPRFRIYLFILFTSLICPLETCHVESTTRKKFWLSWLWAAQRGRLDALVGWYH